MKISTLLIDKLYAVKQALDTHPEVRFHIEDVNSTIYTDRHFAAAFRQQFNTSFYQYQLKASMSFACKLLRAGASVKSVAIILKYETVKSFSRAYKKVYKVPPSKHRKCI